jgi:hypothetical protein
LNVVDRAKKKHAAFIADLTAFLLNAVEKAYKAIKHSSSTKAIQQNDKIYLWSFE